MSTSNQTESRTRKPIEVRSEVKGFSLMKSPNPLKSIFDILSVN